MGKRKHSKTGQGNSLPARIIDKPIHKSPKLLDSYESIAACASALNVNQSILKVAKRNGCNAFMTGGRINTYLAVRFLFGMVVKQSELPEGFSGWGEVLNMEKSKREAIRRQKDEGLLMPTLDARRQNGEAWSFVFSELNRLANEYPPALAGLPAIEICKRLKSFMEHMRRDAKSKFESAA